MARVATDWVGVTARDGSMLVTMKLESMVSVVFPVGAGDELPPASADDDAPAGVLGWSEDVDDGTWSTLVALVQADSARASTPAMATTAAPRRPGPTRPGAREDILRSMVMSFAPLSVGTGGSSGLQRADDARTSPHPEIY
jgi:hypothetical protein